MRRIKFRLYELRKRLELKKGRDYSWEEIATQAGVSRSTIDRMVSNRKSRFDLEAIEKLLAFFEREGLATELTDLVVLEPEPPNPQTASGSA
jgi:transcriptional regulator with XRE-family HTH domain